MQTSLTDTSAVARSTEAANRRFMESFNAGDVEGAARGVYTADARILPPGAELVRGREAIAQFWKGAAQALGITRVQLTTLDLAVHGDHAHEIGRADLAVAGGEQQVVSKYVVIWKQEGGEWRWDIDIWNMNA